MKFEAGLHDFADFAPVPPDTYEFVIKDPLAANKVQGEKTDIGGQQFTFVLFVEIASGEQAGKRVRRQFSNKSKGARYFMKSFMEKIGIAISSDGAFSSEDFLGKRFKATVGERMYKDDGGNDKKASDLDTESAVAL